MQMLELPIERPMHASTGGQAHENSRLRPRHRSIAKGFSAPRGMYVFLLTPMGGSQKFIQFLAIYLILELHVNILAQNI